MKCLSLKQPYAYLLASGKKTIEIRKWNTKYRGEFLIHASKTMNDEACYVLNIERHLLVKGEIIGKGFLYDVKTYDTCEDFKRDWDKHFSIEKSNSSPSSLSSSKFKRYGFLVKDTILFSKPIPFIGKLGMFEVDL